MSRPSLQHTVLLASDCPANCLNEVPVMLGIDEAGRGPVMGPMVYGAAYWPAAENEAMCTLGFDDSKTLSAESRAQLFKKMQSTQGLGCVTNVAAMHWHFIWWILFL
ncbi:unnamed protein product [Peronospora destructor]|uniref:Ribonuclease n=1 Tax=Peronospora destructor TaxID=86335 RepID=A0AAV0U9C6_9STRA|nr:unnamed protein product [Peronospora destructor]